MDSIGVLVRKSFASIAVIVLLMVLFACGGGGSPGTTGTTATTSTTSGGFISNAQFSVTWPLRTRTALVHSLTSAASVKVVFVGAGTNNTDVVLNANRTTESAYTGTYTVPGSVSQTVSLMHATFYAGADQSGDAVGTADAPVSINGSTLSLGTIVIDGVIKSVDVVPPPTLVIDRDPTQLFFTARATGGAIVPVDMGAGTWTITGSTVPITLTDDGVAHGRIVGTTSVKATVDGISSSATNITVVASARTEIGATYWMGPGALPAPAYTPSTFDRMKSLNLGWVRMQLQWKDSHASNGDWGVYDGSTYADTAVRAAIAKGLKVLLTIGNPYPFNANDPNTIYVIPDAGTAKTKWLSYINGVAAGFKDLTDSGQLVYEFWNKPADDSSGFQYDTNGVVLDTNQRATVYTALFSATSAAIKAQSASAKMVGPSLGTGGVDAHTNPADKNFAGFVMQQGLLDVADGLSVEFNKKGSNGATIEPEDRLNDIITWKSLAGNKELWITEWPFRYGSGTEQQSQILRSYLVSLSEGVQVHIIHEYIQKTTTYDNQAVDQFFDGFGMENPDGTPREVWARLQWLTSQLDGYTVSQKMTKVQNFPPEYQMIFTNGTTNKTVRWGSTMTSQYYNVAIL